MLFKSTATRRVFAVAISLLAGLLLCLLIIPHELDRVREHLRGFPDSDVIMHGLRPYILAAVFFLPAVATIFYAMAGILSRWMIREFLSAMFICYGGILLIYFLIDFSNNASRFGESDNFISSVLLYYARMAPAITMLLLPFGLLFSLIYCTSRISRSREIVAAMQSGRSLWSIMSPLYFCGLVGTLLYLGLNFHWAPMAEAMKGSNMDEARGRTGKLMNHAVYYYPIGQRMWMVTEIPRGFDRGESLKGVEVTSLNRDGSLASRLYADDAVWDEKTGNWTFYGVELTDHHKSQAPIFVRPEEPYLKTEWRETPAQIVQLGMDVRHLGIPDLQGMMRSDMSAQWLERDLARYKTQWHYRVALPFTCLMYAAFALPLSMFVTRRPHGATMGVTIILAIVSVLLSSVSLALGESGNVSPLLAAWSPIVLFVLLGVWMMRRRVRGRALWPLVG